MSFTDVPSQAEPWPYIPFGLLFLYYLKKNTHTTFLSLNLFIFNFFGHEHTSLFIYLSLVAPDLCSLTWAFSSCDDWGLFFTVVCGLLVSVASLAVEQGSR